MRTAAAEQQRAHAFNAFLEGLAERYKLDTGRSQYWQQLLTNGVTIIGTDDEVEDFLRRHREEDEVLRLLLHYMPKGLAMCICSA